jgi:hypothetical protein
LTSTRGKHFPWRYYNIALAVGPPSSIRTKHSGKKVPNCADMFHVNTIQVARKGNKTTTLWSKQKNKVTLDECSAAGHFGKRK